MGRLSENYTKREQKKGRAWTCVIYPDSTEYDCETLLNRLDSFWERWYYILHDQDTYTDDDLDKYTVEHKGEYPDWKIGDKKKPHYHVVAYVSSPCMLGRAAKKFGVESNNVQPVSKLKDMVQYLIHLNNPNKYQYRPEEVISNDNSLSTMLTKTLDTEEKAGQLLDYIFTSGCYSMRQLSQFALENHLWDELRRGQHLYGLLLKEQYDDFVRRNLQKLNQ